MSTDSTACARTRDPICPPWCAGHDELFQPWAQFVNGPGLVRSHCSNVDPGESLGISVTLDQEEHHLIGMVAPVVRVFLDIDGSAELTPDGARALARRLLDAADTVSESR